MKFVSCCVLLFVTAMLGGCQTQHVQIVESETNDTMTVVPVVQTKQNEPIHEVVTAVDKAVPVSKPVSRKKTLAVKTVAVPEEIFFRYSDVQSFAQKLALSAYEGMPTVSPLLRSLPYAEWQMMEYKRETLPQSGTKSRIMVKPVSAGSVYESPVTIHWVSAKEVQEVEIPSADFEMSEKLAAQLEEAIEPIAGFDLYDRRTLKQVFSFLGATYFKGTPGGRESSSALGLILHDGQKEMDFPRFTDFWILKPSDSAKKLQVYALMQSPLVTGAYEFEIELQKSVVCAVKNTLFRRSELPKGTVLGLYPAVSMFYEMDNQKKSGYRANTLVMEDKDGARVVMLSNPHVLTRRAYPVTGFRGFSLVDRGLFDTEQKLERDIEPSVHIRAESFDDEGVFQLVLIPTTNTLNNNVYVYFRPNALRVFDPSVYEKGTYSYRYTIAWNGQQTSHRLGYVSKAMVQETDDPELFQVTLRFSGGPLTKIGPMTGLSAQIDLAEGLKVSEKRLKKIDKETWEVSFRLRAPVQRNLMSSLLNRQMQSVSSREIQVYIRLGDNRPEPLTEVWSHEFLR